MDNDGFWCGNDLVVCFEEYEIEVGIFLLWVFEVFVEVVDEVQCFVFDKVVGGDEFGVMQVGCIVFGIGWFVLQGYDDMVLCGVDVWYYCLQFFMQLVWCWNGVIVGEGDDFVVGGMLVGIVCCGWVVC